MSLYIIFNLLLRILKQSERSVAEFRYQLANQKIQLIVFIYEYNVYLSSNYIEQERLVQFLLLYESEQ